MSRRQLAFTAVLLATLASPLSAQTVQQRFEAATAKLDAGDAAGGLVAFELLEKELTARPRPPARSLALVHAGKGEALTKLRRYDEARAAYAAALNGGALDAPGTIKVRDAALVAAAQLDEVAFDHGAGARRFLRLGEAGETTAARIVGLTGAARLLMFTDPDAALATVDRAVALMPADASFDKADQATVVGTRGRILLNMGRTKEARRELARAVSLRGGLTLKVDQWDVALRSDAALAALRDGGKDEARKYLAYTGTGRTQVQFPVPAVMPLPACGEAGIGPDDVAVVQLAVLDDGTVAGAQPVLASRPGDMAYEFARVASEWQWRAEELKGLDSFFRIAARFELRCSSAASRPPATAELYTALAEWLAGNGVTAEETQTAPAFSALQAELAALGPKGKPAERIAILEQLARHPAGTRDQRAAYAAEARTLVNASDAPAAARLAVALTEIDVRTAADKRAWRGAASRHANALVTLLDDAAIAGDPRLRAMVRLAAARQLGWARRTDEERAMLEAIANDAALGDKDQLKIGALVSLANIAAAQKRLDEARAAYARTGLTAQQCALVDGGPVMRRANSSSSDFPQEAMNWGFEGWSSAEFDISADGRPVNIRTVAAYPPEVFAEAGRGVIGGARYAVSYRPEGDLACGGMQQRVRFSLPWLNR